MSDLEQLGISLSYRRPGEDPERAATIRAALAGMSPEPGAGVVIPLPRPAAVRLGIKVSLHAYGLVGSYLVARQHPEADDSFSEAFARSMAGAVA